MTTDPTAGERKCDQSGDECDPWRLATFPHYTTAEPDAGDVEALTDALYADGDLGPGYMMRDDREHLARRFLASPWLDAVRRKAGDERADLFAQAVEAEWFNGNITEDVRDRLLARIAREHP